MIETNNDGKQSVQPQSKSNQTSLFHKQLPQEKGKETIVSHTMPQRTGPHFIDLRRRRTGESPQELRESNDADKHLKSCS